MYNKVCYIFSMTGTDLKRARKKSGRTQLQAAKRLGVSQAYVSMLERERRHLPEHLVSRILRSYDVSPLALPLVDPVLLNALGSDELAEALATHGYPGFAYMGAGRKLNPMQLLLAALGKTTLDRRVAEALPWLVLHFHEMDWEWVVRQAKVRDLQNRLGFTVVLAKDLAVRKGDKQAADRLHGVEEQLRNSLLAKQDTFCNETMTNAERQWLLKHRPHQAKQWNLLSDMTPEHLTDAA
jgi:transcriptional regulator with XRE-family HTH domain